MWIREIWGSHSSEDVDVVLGGDAVCTRWYIANISEKHIVSVFSPEDGDESTRRHNQDEKHRQCE
jgi:hypothetical protein